MAETSLNGGQSSALSPVKPLCQDDKRGIKRPKTELPVGAAEKKPKREYLKGSIVRIKLQNFLTFDDVELIPGAKLNVIAGANGSGKSSIMCGICLGLAGHPKLLGRAKELKDFVKYGRSEAFIEIELFNPCEHNPVIRRQIHCDNNSSTWILNGKSSHLKEIKEVVSDMNVQIANRCQFLPQDMVVEFARMNSYELLEETEKTVGTTEMFELHQKLKSMKTGHKDIYKRLKEKEELLEKKTRDNQMIENDVSQAREGHHAVTCLRILREKKSWMFYGVARKHYLETKKNKNKAESVWNRIHDEHESLENQIKHLDTVIQSLSKNEQECKKKINDKRKEIQKDRDTLNQLDNEIDKTEDEFVDKRIQEHQRRNKLVHKRTEVEGMECLLATMAPMDKCQQGEEVDVTDVVDLTLHDDQDEEESDLEDDEEVRRLFGGTGNIRLQTLWGKNKICYNIVRWLRKNQSCFQHAIIEPMILVANCRDQQYLKQVEGFLNNQHKFSFIAQTEEDMIKLKKEVREKLKLSVNVILDPKAISNSEDVSKYTPFYDINEMRQYGFDQWMINLIDAPAPTLRVLCKYHYLHNVFVAKDMSAQQIARVVDEIGDRVRKFFTSSENVTVIISKYGSQVKSAILKFLCEPEYLGFPQDDVKLEVKPLITNGNGEKIVIDLDEFEEKAKKHIKAIRKRKTNSTRGRAKLTSTINTMRIQLSELENSAIDLVAEENACKQAVLKLRHDQVECMQKIAALVYTLTTDQREYTIAQLQQQAVVMQKEQVQKCQIEVKHRLEEAEAQLNDAKKIADDTKERGKQLLLQAQKLSGLTNHSDIPPEKQQQYDSFPNDLEEVEGLMHEYKIKAEMCRNMDTRCVEQYDKRRKEIKLLKQEVNELQNKYADYTERMEEMKDKWLDPLKSLIGRVDEKFSTFFRDMGCAGEISLLEDKDNDFSKYGIVVKVKFRSEEDLQVLTTCRQSGGERNVATMLYLMALQDIASSPFRAVDEINQLYHWSVNPAVLSISFSHLSYSKI
ncbi:structural maintenance of chromosomes protein 5-like isoform X2 [Dysidea avara]|uniref:structural maintenance of chromosomes protein 5-like isoform X2 n=1 Tax=Dysidea avara TaxID=196820 RepID=UPI00333256D5